MKTCFSEETQNNLQILIFADFTDFRQIRGNMSTWKVEKHATREYFSTRYGKINL